MKRKSAQATPAWQRDRRRAFSLIELLVVMVIIAILAGFLIPAIGRVRRTARLTEVKTEMKQLDASIAAFKARFGVTPPSAIVLPNPANNRTWDPISRRRIRSIWPQFNFATIGGIPAAYFGGRDYIVLTGAECLAFFLGGMPQNSGVGGPPVANQPPILTGFSKNPRTPFNTLGSNRDGPFYEFDAARLVDVDGDLFAEYVDPLPGQTVPMLYVSSNNGKGYPQQCAGAIDDYDVFNGNNATDPDNNNQAELYNNSLGAWTDFGFATGNLWAVYNQGTAGPWKKESYQIISPGEDGQYGDPNTVRIISPPGCPGPNNTGVPNSNYVGRANFTDADSVAGAEQDNLANFHDGLTFSGN